MGKKHGVKLGGPARTGLGLTKGDTIGRYLDNNYADGKLGETLAEALKAAKVAPSSEA